MKLITLNTWQGRFFRNFEPFFKSEDADIICLQELNRTEGYIPTYHSLETWNDLKMTTGLKHTFYSPVWSYDIMGREVDFGNGLLSRYPIAQEKTLFTHGSYRKVSADDYETNVRNAQIAKLDVDGTELTVVNHHAHWEPNGMGSPISLEKVKLIVEALGDIAAPLIIAGDFNLSGESKALQHLTQALGLRDLTLECGLQNTLNNLVTPYSVPCDHIFVSNDVSVKKFAMSNELLSDHKALILEFDLK